MSQHVPNLHALLCRSNVQHLMHCHPAMALDHQAALDARRPCQLGTCSEIIIPETPTLKVQKNEVDHVRCQYSNTCKIWCFPASSPSKHGCEECLARKPALPPISEDVEDRFWTFTQPASLQGLPQCSRLPIRASRAALSEELMPSGARLPYAIHWAP